MAEEFVAIMNPAAGGGRCGKQAGTALTQLRDAGITVDVLETRASGDATRLAREAYEGGKRHFIAVGGDGTSYEIINGLFPLPDGSGDEDRPTLGFLPMGTGNSFLRDFTEEGAKHSIAAIIDDRRRPCDVIRFRHDGGVLHYINILSIGFVADVNGLRQRRFSAFGEGGYVLAVLTEVIRLKPSVFPMRVDEGPIDREPVSFISINNSRFTGGKMMMAPDADTADGLADVIRVGEMGRFALIREFPNIFKGTHVQNPVVTTDQVHRVDFEVEGEIDVMIDGEAIRVVPERLDVLPSAIDVRV